MSLAVIDRERRIEELERELKSAEAGHRLYKELSDERKRELDTALRERDEARAERDAAVARAEQSDAEVRYILEGPGEERTKELVDMRRHRDRLLMRVEFLEAQAKHTTPKTEEGGK